MPDPDKNVLIHISKIFGFWDTRTQCSWNNARRRTRKSFDATTIKFYLNKTGRFSDTSNLNFEKFLIGWFVTWTAEIVFELESDACQTPDGQTGECIDIFQCEKILNLIKCPANLIGDYVRRSTCGFLRYNPKVSWHTWHIWWAKAHLLI